jgi:positive regulator of sigma E activity
MRGDHEKKRRLPMGIPEYIGTIKTQKAVVLKSSEGRIRVALKECAGRGGCQGCTACGQQESPAPKLTIPVKNAAGFTAGQEIRIRRLALNEGLAAGIVFGLPLLAALAAIIISQVLRPDSLEAPTTVVATVGALAVGLLMAIAVEVYITRRHPVEILEKAPSRREDR